MSFPKIKNLVEKNKLDIGSLWDGNPVFQDIIKIISEKHKIGIFESINKLIRRSALEDEDTLILLWDSNLIVFKNLNDGDEYRVNRLGNIEKLYEKIQRIS